MNMANKIDASNNSVRENRKNKPVLNNLENDTNSTKALMDKLNAVSSRIAVLCDQKPVHDKLDQLAAMQLQTSAAQANAQPLQKSSFRRPNYRGNTVRFDSIYKGICFCCNKNGHKYMDCTTATEAEKQHVRENFYQKLREYKAGKFNTSLNANGVSTTSQ